MELLFILIFQTILLLVVSYNHFKRSNLEFFLYSILLIIFPVSELIHQFTSVEGKFKSDTILLPNIYLLLCMLSIVAGNSFCYYLKRNNRNKYNECKNSIQLKHPQMYLLIAVGIGGAALMMISMGFGLIEAFSVPRLVIREKMFESFASFIGQYMFLAFGPVVFLAINLPNKRIYTFIGIIFSILMPLLFGYRTLFLVPIGPIFIAALNIEKKKKRILILSILGLILLISVVVFQRVRWLSKRDISNVIQLYTSRDTYAFIFNDRLSELNYRFKMYQAYEIYSTREDFLNGNTYLRLSLFWLPSKLSFGIKPEDTMYKYSRAINPNTLTKLPSEHPTLFGDMFINFGWLGAPLCLFWGYFLGYLNWSFKKHKNWLHIGIGGNFIMFILLIIRGAIYTGFMPLIACICICLIIDKLSAILQNRLFNK